MLAKQMLVLKWDLQLQIAAHVSKKLTVNLVFATLCVHGLNDAHICSRLEYPDSKFIFVIFGAWGT